MANPQIRILFVVVLCFLAAWLLHVLYSMGGSCMFTQIIYIPCFTYVCEAIYDFLYG